MHRRISITIALALIILLLHACSILIASSTTVKFSEVCTTRAIVRAKFGTPIESYVIGDPSMPAYLVPKHIQRKVSTVDVFKVRGRLGKSSDGVGYAVWYVYTLGISELIAIPIAAGEAIKGAFQVNRIAVFYDDENECRGYQPLLPESTQALRG